MKTLDRNKSESLFYRIKSLGETISNLKMIVQNPDYINIENGKMLYSEWEEHLLFYKEELNKVHKEVKELFENLNES